MGFTESLCKGLNKIFPKPVHPFNLQDKGVKSYAEWQYEKGIDTIRYYLRHTTVEDMFKDKVVLDVGCGAGGKTLYYASEGPEMVYGLEIVDYYEKEAKELAEAKGLSDKFQFVVGDASKIPFEDGHFDTIIMNDAMEHVDEPLKVLKECYRTLKPGGRLYVNFPPYYHPYGAHLSDAIGFPWVHLFFSDKTLIRVYKDLVKDLKDGEKRIDFRISKNEEGQEYFSYLNKMTIKRFNKILKETDYKLEYYHEEALRSYFKPLAKIPGVKEAFTRMVVSILEKPKD